jgi:hypothetical protein
LDSKKYGQKNHFAEVSDRRSRVGVRNDEPRDNEKKSLYFDIRYRHTNFIDPFPDVGR